ncbi:hypothetical protein, partial [Halorubrum sp. GN11_10-6_MGM]|uniref:hypothetical protein n=1 Tax=Halorubrum sp. GN11_10-6_MGM TaxID=2518112 RepID=UPI001A7E17A1
TVSVAAAFKKSSTEATFCRVALVLDTLSAPCRFVRDAFYDTLSWLKRELYYPIKMVWIYGALV